MGMHVEGMVEGSWEMQVACNAASAAAEAAAEAAKAVEDAKRDFALTALTESLAELGYQIGEPFETTLAATGHTFQRDTKARQ